MTDETSSSDRPGRGAPGRSRGVRLAIGGAIVVATMVVGGAVAVAVGSDDDSDDEIQAEHASQAGEETHHADSDDEHPDDEHHDGEARAGDSGADEHHDDEAAASPSAGGEASARGRAGGMGGMGGVHPHEPLPPYQQRHREASAEEQAAADELRSQVRTAIAGFAEVDAAVAAGYEPGDTSGPLAHYLDRSVAEEGHVLDPARPNGLVYYIGGEGDPVLVGAFFVALPGVEAPMPAGDLVVWHSHSPGCPGFFATEAAPCTDARRMLHVWTADQVEAVTRRTGRTVDMQVVDPFGAPFGAAVDPLA
jgi:hypothetical protein